MGDVNTSGTTREEIDLYPYWLAVRRRGWMILALVVLAAVGSAVATRYLPRIYRANALISLGRVESGGRVSTVANLADVHQMAGSGSLLKKLAEAVRLESPNQPMTGGMLRHGLTAQASDKGEYIALSFDSPSPALGVRVLGLFIEELDRTFNRRVERFRKVAQAEIDRRRSEKASIESTTEKAKAKLVQLRAEIEVKKQLAVSAVNALQAQKASMTAQIANYRQRIQSLDDAGNQMRTLTASLEKNTAELLKGKSDLARVAAGESVVTSLLFANDLQQSIQSVSLNQAKVSEYQMQANDARQEIDLLEGAVAATEGKIRETQLLSESEINKLQTSVRECELDIDRTLPAEMAKIQSDLAAMEARMEMIEGIETIAEPDYLNLPVKPRSRMIVILSGALALCVGVFLALFLEWQAGHALRRRTVNG